MGKNGEMVSEKVQKTAVFGLKSGKNGTFLRSQFASDSVIRWFESSYPSQILALFSEKNAKKCLFLTFFRFPVLLILSDRGANRGVNVGRKDVLYRI